jgi:hypothetical protein
MPIKGVWLTYFRLIPLWGSVRQKDFHRMIPFCWGVRRNGFSLISSYAEVLETAAPSLLPN